MTEVTRILNRIEHGDQAATADLLALVYDDLRKLAAAKMAHEQAGQTLQATALVHEAYLRLVDQERPQSWDSRGHFFAAASEAMRRILVEKARRKQALKHGGRLNRQQLEPNDLAPVEDHDPAELLAVHEALDLLGERSPRRAELVKLRYFLGCTVAESADILGIAPATAEEDWTFAKAWLRRQLRRES